MQLHQRTLANGLKLQAVAMPGTKVITTLVLAEAGSRYEDKSISGIAHFLEHMFFKGAKKYTTPKAVSEAIDRFGGEFNAFTGKEYVGYYVKSGKAFFPQAVDVLSDMLCHARLDPTEIEKEKGVILEEMAMYMDAPMYQISWDFEQLVFGDQPLGRDQIGTREFIQAAKQENFQKYRESLYTPDNMVITIAGAVDEKHLDILEEFFVFKPEKKSYEKSAFNPKIATKKTYLRQKKTEQFHLSCGVRSLSEIDPKYPTLKVLATILGGNMSSRMFQKIREQKSLCYSIRTQVDEFSDTGLLTTSAGVKLDNAISAINAIKEEYEFIASKGISDEELTKGIAYLQGKNDLATEDTESVAHHYGKNKLLYDEEESFQDWHNRLTQVTRNDVESLATELFTPDAFRLAGIGNSISEKEWEKLI